MNGLQGPGETEKILKNLACLSQNGQCRDLRAYLNQVLPEARVSGENPDPSGASGGKVEVGGRG